MFWLIYMKNCFLRNEFDFKNVHEIMKTSCLVFGSPAKKVKPKGLNMLTLQETRSIHDSMNIQKLNL